MQFTRSHTLTLLSVGLLTAFVYLVYMPGLNGPFVFDDAPNITENPAIKITELNIESIKKAAFSIPAGPLYRPVSFISFALNYYIFELDTFSYKVVNLLIHYGVGIAIFWCAFLILSMVYFDKYQSLQDKRRIYWTAFLISSVFLLHPFNVSSVLYVVQRMNSLAALFMFLSLGFYLQGRMKMYRLSDVSSGGYGFIIVCWAISVFVFFPLAIFSKENALLLPFLVLVIETILFRWHSAQLSHERLLKLLRILLYLGLVVVIIAAFFGWDRIMSGYAHRDFTLTERLLTEPYILFRYLTLVVLPINSGMTFYHDDIHIFSSITDGTAFLYVLFWLSLIVFALIFRRKAKWFAFAVLWFLIAHSMESSVIALELAHEHRNYVPMFGILLAIGAVFLASTRVQASGKMYLLLALFALLVLGGSTLVRATAWGNMESLVERQQRLNPESPRANYAVGQFLFAHLLLQDSRDTQEQIYQRIVPYFLAVNKYDPTDFSGLLSLIRLNDQMGYHLNSEWLEQVDSIARVVPLGQADLSHVQDFLHCQLNTYCHVDPVVTKGIIDAVLGNSSLAKGFKVTLTADMGIYLSINNMHSEAATYLVDAVTLSPKWWVIRLSAANSLVATGQLKKALSLLEETKVMDVPADYNAAFTDLITKISDLEDSTSWKE